MFYKITRFILPLFIFLTPLLFCTLSPDIFTTPKQLLLVILILILLITYSVSIFRHKTLTLPRSILVIPLLGMIFAIILNLLFIAEGRGDALAGKGTLLLILPLLSLLILTVTPRINLVKAITAAVIGSSVVLALHSLLQLTYLHTASFLPTFMQTRNFTPTGSFLTTLILILTGGVTAVSALKHTSSRLRPFYLAVIVLITIATVAIISLMLPSSPLTLNLIPYRETWSITLDALKPVHSLLLGVGISNFPLLFSAVKPLTLNVTPLWNTLPQTGTSELLNLLATTGFAGFLSLLALIGGGIRLARRTMSPLSPTFILVSLALILTPGTLPLYLLFFVILPLLDEDRDLTLHLSARTSLTISTLILASTLALTVYALRPYVADYYLHKAQVALANNNGKDVYNAHIQAIKWYPQSTLNHLSFAQTNLKLASALSQKKDLTEADRSTISTLVQQSISEGKTAIRLHPNYSLTWVTLAQIYRNLINVAKGSDRFALDYYARAVALDAGNPALRVEYGGLFYQLGLSVAEKPDKATYFVRAASEFTIAIQLRPTYANAYYNLSKVLETQGDIPNSYLAMQKVVANLDSSSSEYSTALSELDALKTKLPPPTPRPSPASVESSELTSPSPLPSPLPGGPIDLPATN
ncbi:MAG: hypothetical protein UX62_C0005G0008 [Microgenomates group bacterium GW2011_GWA2_46_7]|nr:MAG: hypothetical protein UX62_C0005G0008 [Microgenomates group bacterium GW2011_GWA2_46_7]